MLQGATKSALGPTPAAVASPVDELLVEVDQLAQSSTPESIERLKQLLFAIGQSRTLRPLGRARRLPTGGDVSGAAARALVSRADNGGLTVVEEVLFDDAVPRVIRETAAYGLGRLSSPSVFDLYARALVIADPDVRFSVLLSFRESLDRTNDPSQVSVQHALQTLSRLFAVRMRTLEGGEHDVIVSILWRYLDGEGERHLIKMMHTSRDPVVLSGVLEVLHRRERASVQRGLLEVFQSLDLPPFLYGMIADELRGRCVDGDSHTIVARKIVSSYPLVRRLAFLFASSERTRRAAHLRAAALLLAPHRA